MAVFAIDVEDVATLHVAAIIDPELKNARVQAWGHNINWNDLLAILRKLYPLDKFLDDIPNLPHLAQTTDSHPALALLKKWAGQDGWKPLESTVVDNMRPLLKWFPRS